MKVISLASGSSGNCYAVHYQNTTILIDAGLSANLIEKYLHDKGLAIEQVAAIFLTHEHSDHLKAAGTLSRRYGIPVISSPLTLKAAKPKWDKIERLAEARAGQFGYAVPDTKVKYNLQEMAVGSARNIGGLEISSVPVSHDSANNVCYVLRAGGLQAMILTDLGCATTPIFEPLYKSDLIILEANYDHQKLIENEAYPAFLKARISSDRGHLSNQQSAEILKQVIEYSGINHEVWLAHLSEENNNPKNARKMITTCLENATILNFPLKVAGRDKPSLTWQGPDQLFQAQMAFEW